MSQEFERTRRMAIPSWEETKGTLEIRTHNNSTQHSLLINNQDFLRDSYKQVYDAFVSGKKVAKSNDGGPLAYHLRIIREKVTGKPEKRSRGFAKGIRRQKALSAK
ncbi:MAG: hypothetical protein A2798_03215 [Candidatus Levybacteria bacterium RIFCSPHIGHO2_01_FULL_37_17]|nr:MAG: hypothetical protein A2798_03215 [Candidatus Levybacteria bacterium RIFCSPHIGHO2_01_FULL_37_17]OGH36864.1 MAG: hypothetical protein A2959_01205 [Candidatus Levybacteria bacterium RIFCSPLOWO2_01_FULL_38_23]